MSRREDVLLHRWRQLGSNDAVGRELLGRYAEPGRAYHDQRHLAYLLIMIDRLAAGTEDLRSVRLAGWFHDAVYAVGRTARHTLGNEEASARLAVARLTAAGTDADTVAEVARLVRLTERHDATADDPNGALLCDADMSILAAGPERYARYAAAIRSEHAELDVATYAAGRSAFLRTRLDAPVFATRAGRVLESRARANIAAELAQLQTEAERMNP